MTNHLENDSPFVMLNDAIDNIGLEMVMLHYGNVSSVEVAWKTDNERGEILFTATVHKKDGTYCVHKSRQQFARLTKLPQEPEMQQSTWEMMTPQQQTEMRDTGRASLDGDRVVSLDSDEFKNSDFAKKNEASWPTARGPGFQDKPDPKEDYDDSKPGPLDQPEDEDDDSLEDFIDDPDGVDDEDEDDDS